MLQIVHIVHIANINSGFCSDLEVRLYTNVRDCQKPPSKSTALLLENEDRQHHELEGLPDSSYDDF